ncbi:MAG: diacylglycerol kinase [bacterium]
MLPDRSCDTLIEKINYAIEGIIYAVRTQGNLRFHLLAAALVLVASAVLPISKIDLLFIVVVISSVLVAELLNTAIEEMINMISPDYHTQAKIIKDIAAGAVLVAAIGAIAIGSLIFIPHILPPAFKTVGFFHRLSENEFAAYTILFSLLVVIILIVIGKAMYGRGEPLHGGMPSGHSAIAFSMGTAIAFLTSNAIVIVLAFFLGIMVSHSRLLLKIHTRQEVIAGALLGGLVTAGIFILFRCCF